MINIDTIMIFLITSLKSFRNLVHFKLSFSIQFVASKKPYVKTKRQKKANIELNFGSFLSLI